MTVPTSIIEPPMGHTEQEPHLKSKSRKLLISMDLIQHVFQTVMGLTIDEQLEQLSYWIEYRDITVLMPFMIVFVIIQRMSMSMKMSNGMVSRIALVSTLYRKSKASSNG